MGKSQRQTPSPQFSSVDRLRDSVCLGHLDLAVVVATRSIFPNANPPKIVQLAAGGVLCRIIGIRKLIERGLNTLLLFPLGLFSIASYY